jgi:hypothetical protein
MDWPLTAVLTGMGAAVCAAGVYGVILVRNAPVPVAKKPFFSVQLAPGVDPATFYREQPRLDILPLQPLDPPPPEAASPEPAEPVVPKAKKSPVVQRPAPEPSGKAAPPSEQKKMASIDPRPADPRPAPKAPAAAPPVVVEQVRVVATSQASMFNLGGHINRAGIVDSMASPHLKEALQKHRNFGKLPPAMQAHVNSAPNLDLNKLAPYRGLLGMDDSMMETQGVRFERVARR